MGRELGKQLANSILDELNSKKQTITIVPLPFFGLL
jgi:hypothetical protein